MKRMPVLFVGHGSPMNIVEKNIFTDGWRDMAALNPRPEAILCVSAHWYTKGDFVSTTESPKTIYDFYGFPEELYKISYPAKGSPEFAQRVVDLSGTVKADPVRGLDHGAWSVLHFMYPHADIPVFQMSVNTVNTPQESYEAGQRLSVLRDEGVLILGSGNIVHNLSLVDWDMQGGFDWADAFDDYIKSVVVNGRYEDAVHYQKAGQSVRQAFYYRDHYEPLLYVLGAARSDDTVSVYNDARVMGAISMTSYIIG